MSRTKHQEHGSKPRLFFTINCKFIIERIIVTQNLYDLTDYSLTHALFCTVVAAR